MNAKPIFLTGASGFVGRRVIAALAASRVPSLRLLARNPERLALPQNLPNDWRVIHGDLAASDPWRAHLAGVDTLIHLAALTGKGRRDSHMAANRDATRLLLDEAKSAGVRRFLFVSSKAAGYADQRYYYYARAKAEAEALVRSSRLETLIVRPTMILGPGSAVLDNLRRLALLPIPVVFGPGTEVQPIHVEDVSAAIVGALSAAPWPSDPVELGGPEVLPLTDLLTRIRVISGRSPRRPIHLPLAPIRALLAALEPVAFNVLPFTAGQLAAFANTASARPHPFLASLPPPRFGVEAMLAE